MIEPEKYELFRRDNGIAVYRREVETPMPEDDSGSGYTTEENYIWAYQVGPHWLKVSKVSDHGWTVRHYEEDGGNFDIVGRVGSKENAQKAQRLALHTAEALA